MKGLLYFMTVITYLAKAFLAMRDYQRRLDEKELREELLEQQARLNEVKIAQAHNRTMLDDLKIEEQTLKVLKLRRELGMTSEEFKPENYDY